MRDDNVESTSRSSPCTAAKPSLEIRYIWNEYEKVLAACAFQNSLPLMQHHITHKNVAMSPDPQAPLDARNPRWSGTLRWVVYRGNPSPK